LSSKKRKKSGKPDIHLGENVEIAGAGITIESPITETLKENYMPYAMSVIVSRAIPEIDGLKPSHRKLLYTMHLMGLGSGSRTKSANIVGQTMKLNPHGDQAIYETLVRMSRGNETLLHPYVDSKGNFGKWYSRDMAFAASRYTEAKLSEISAELFKDIGKDTVDFVDNYDNRMKEPRLLPVTFPTILVNSNIGIAVGMSSSISSFNLAEVCETVVSIIKNPDHNITSTLKAPDFPGGGYYLFDPEVMKDVVDEGRGSFKIRARYEVIGNSIEITEIPPTTTVEAIIDKISELIKQGKVKEIADMRDETDIRGLRIALDLKRGVNAGKLMNKLFKLTTLEDNFSCNFTVLIDGAPRQLGVRDILNEWIRFRRDCIRRRTQFDLNTKERREHLLNGLSKILLDIDKAIKIIRETEDEREVVPNLMIGFGIDELQAEFIAEIRLRQLNRDYVLKRIDERKGLQTEIAELREILRDDKKIDRIIMREQAEVAKKFAKPRRTKILYDYDDGDFDIEEEREDYPVNVFFTKEGYFKKITPLSLRMSSEHKLKDGDEIIYSELCNNSSHILVFTNLRNVYKCRAFDFEDSKASVMGDYLPSSLEMQEDELAVAIAVTDDYSGNIIFFYKDGKVSKTPLNLYKTVQNRKKLTSSYSPKSEIRSVFTLQEDEEFAIFTGNGRMLLIDSSLIAMKMSRGVQGNQIIKLRKGFEVENVKKISQLEISNPHKFRSKNIPAAGGIVREGDVSDKLPE